VKDHLLSTISQWRLDALAIMNIEAKFVRKLNFTEFIDEFAVLKACKRDLWSSDSLSSKPLARTFSNIVS